MIRREFVYGHDRKTRTSNNGSSTSSSMTMNKARQIRDRAMRAVTLNDVQPQLSPSESANSIENRPTAMVTKPRVSNFVRAAGGNFGRMAIAANVAKTPTGTLMKKISRQSTYSTR